MDGKYSSRLKYRVAQAQRIAMRAVLSPMAGVWEPLRDPIDGYTICIGGASKLAGMLGANLELLARQDLSHCDRIYVVWDAPRERVGDVEERARAAHPELPLEFVYYTRAESRVLDAIGFPGGYSWFSWQKAIGRCRTRHAILHDFDALLLRPTLLEERWRATVEAGAQWCGQRFYHGMGVDASDGLATTFEMVLDAEYVRSRFRPIDGFNRVAMYKGRTVEFDTFLECQTVAGTKSIAVGIPEDDMVHPTQVVHQFTELCHIPGYTPPANNRLLMIPYFLYLGGDREALRRTGEALEGLAGKVDRTIPFMGRSMNLERLGAEHVYWLKVQGHRVEEFMFGGVRDEVRWYFDAVEAAAGRDGGNLVVGGDLRENGGIRGETATV